jgi:hypothetical protein
VRLAVEEDSFVKRAQKCVQTNACFWSTPPNKRVFLVDPTFCFIIYIYSMQKVGLAVEEDSFVKKRKNWRRISF